MHALGEPVLRGRSRDRGTRAKVSAEKVAALAVESRKKMKLRHAPLLLVREMARHAAHRRLVAETLAQVIQRADELRSLLPSNGDLPISQNSLAVVVLVRLTSAL